MLTVTHRSRLTSLLRVSVPLTFQRTRLSCILLYPTMCPAFVRVPPIACQGDSSSPLVSDLNPLTSAASQAWWASPRQPIAASLCPLYSHSHCMYTHTRAPLREGWQQWQALHARCDDTIAYMARACMRCPHGLYVCLTSSAQNELLTIDGNSPVTCCIGSYT